MVVNTHTHTFGIDYCSTSTCKKQSNFINRMREKKFVLVKFIFLHVRVYLCGMGDGREKLKLKNKFINAAKTAKLSLRCKCVCVSAGFVGRKILG
jgi:hypothetical protein